MLAFLHKIKSLFTDVFLNILSLSTKHESTEDVRILIGHLLQMIASIRGICCTNEWLEFLEQHFLGTLALAKELELYDYAEPAYIPLYLNWLNAPLGFSGVHGPRFLGATAPPETIITIVNAVHQVFQKKLKNYLNLNFSAIPGRNQFIYICSFH